MDQDNHLKKCAGAVERASWLLVLFGMLSELSTKYAFPSYNIALGFWGAYCAFTKHGRATFAFICFSFFSLILDIIFCAMNGDSASVYHFCLTMFIFCMFAKIYALYNASLFFTALGGAYSLENSAMSVSAYDSLRNSQHDTNAAYYPPEQSQYYSNSQHGNINMYNPGGVGGGSYDPHQGYTNSVGNQSYSTAAPGGPQTMNPMPMPPPYTQPSPHHSQQSQQPQQQLQGGTYSAPQSQSPHQQQQQGGGGGDRMTQSSMVESGTF